MRVLRAFHGARDPAQRCRDRALAAAGIEITLAMPNDWPSRGQVYGPCAETFATVELRTHRAGDINRHRYASEGHLRELIRRTKPDLLDIHEEPYSVAARQWLRAAPPDLPLVMYTAQNVDKRFPPPYHRYEREAMRRVHGFYPCSHQAAAVVRGKGFPGVVKVVPLGYDPSVYSLGTQSLYEGEVVLMLVGRLVPEKGVDDAIGVLERVHAVRPARLLICGDGPEEQRARSLATSLGVLDRVDFRSWLPSGELASIYRSAHVVLVPSRPTDTWVEQFGRVIVEAQACGAVVAGYEAGAIPEVAGDGALLVPIGAVSQLTERILRLILDPDDFSRRRDISREQSAQRTWASVAEAQAELYDAVRLHVVDPLALPRSARKRRALAYDEFGPTAATSAGRRPFALPVLRRGGAVARALGRIIDAAVELAALLPNEPRRGATAGRDYRRRASL